MKQVKAYINGAFVDKPTTVEVISPLTLAPAGTYPALTKVEIDQAFASARHAFKTWRTLQDQERIKLVRKFKTLLIKNKQPLGQLMHEENGKDVASAVVEIERTGDYIDKTINSWQAVQVKEEVIGNKTSTQLRVPLGVVLAIAPFNYPVNLALAKIIPALLAGNTVVFKAATNGSLVGGFLAELFDQINFPVGVFNYVTGRGRDIGDLLTTHPEIDMISFTGGIKVGHHIARHTIMKPYVLELGGNDAAYVRHDADLDHAVQEIIGGAFGFAGQRCTAIKRVILHEKISKKVIEKLVAKIPKLQLDPVIDLKTATYIKGLFDDAQASGDRILWSGKIDKNKIEPILVLTTPSSRVWKEEPFGPILPIVTVTSDEQALLLINDTNFGLQNSIFTTDQSWAMQFAQQVESGTVNINAKSARGPDEFPFLGIKDSGFGVQGIKNALLSMTRILNIVNNQ